MDLIFGRRFRDNALQGAKNVHSWKGAENGFVCRYLCLWYTWRIRGLFMVRLVLQGQQ